MAVNKIDISNWFMDLQDRICQGLEEIEGKTKFIEDIWVRESGGGGRTRVLKEGVIIEKGGVNYSAVFGKAPSFLIEQLGVDSSSEFYATGVSIVIHPVNPFVPIIHMNVRYFEMNGGISWFGGGIDLTPHYVKWDDGVFFHTQLKDVCDKHSEHYYTEFKKWADNYFFIKHRNETRGIGGIFFDQLKGDQSLSLESVWEFVKGVGNCFLPTYSELISRNKDTSFTIENQNWQSLRRGRYVEFNLVYDRGTKFGLNTEGRTESILMSLPKTASWEYNNMPKKGSQEEFTLSQLKKGIDWVK